MDETVEAAAKAGADVPVTKVEAEPSLPEEFNRICRQAVARNPAHRYPSVAELRSDLFRVFHYQSRGVREEAVKAPKEEGPPEQGAEFCDQCGSQREGGGAFCDLCGCLLRSLVPSFSATYCSACGNSFEEVEIYCSQCGERTV